jgi:hypothetical protein
MYGLMYELFPPSMPSPFPVLLADVLVALVL